MRNAVIGAAAVMTGTTWTPQARAQQAAKEAAAPKLGATLSPNLEVVKKSKGPVMTCRPTNSQRLPASKFTSSEA
jgi:L-serine dehydratase